ncbi:MAG: Panacea domain-containing protein [Verrucomicrobiota bacterium]
MNHIRFKFDEVKTTQAAAYLLKKHGRSMKYLALLKLLYLADRESLKEIESPITGDRYVSMKNGPVLSRVKNLITEEDTPREYWGQYISAPENYSVNLLQDPSVDELCQAEEEILDRVYEEYGRMDAFKLADLTHVICQEWSDPKDGGVGATPITVEQILAAVGKDEDDIQRIKAEVQERAVLDVIMSAKSR